MLKVHRSYTWRMEHTPETPETPTTPPDMARDPVCGMLVRIESAQHVADYEGVTYYFCGRGCRLEFEDDPPRYFQPDYVPSM
ncbi:hypothetical protein BH23CHL8_BH23CHL8_05310 [soil metagenome]